MKKLLFAFSLIIMTLTLITGCNTISGIGKDVSSLGKGVASGAKAME